MENNEIIAIESNHALLNGQQQLEKVNEKILCLQNFPVNDQGNNQSTTVVLKHCKDVHIGPKIEYHNHHLPTTSDPIKIDKPKKSILVKCKERLKNRYITNFAYMRSFFWDGKRNDLPIKDYFVELIVEKSNLFGKKGEKIKLEELFSKEEEGHQTILISGGPGYGKTTLCKKVAYDWATDEISSSYLEHFDLVVVILLRELDDKSLYDFVLYNIFHNAKGEVKSEIEKENPNILVMLDGFDEIQNKISVLKFIREESFDISLRMTILVTSRPQATEDIREDMKSRFSVEGFSEQQQQKYIELMFKDYENKGKELSGMLKEKEFFSEIRKCPLMLHMLCCLYKNDDKGLMESMTDLYIRMFSLLTKRYTIKNGDNYKFIKGKYFLGEDLLIRLGKLLLTIDEITSKDLKTHFPIEEEFNFIVGLDILELYSFSTYDENVYYEFIHLSFREFLSAFAAYCNFPYYNYSTTENALLFLIGLFGRESFPKKLQDFVKQRIFSPKFMVQAYVEIKVIKNWELFCSLSRVKISVIDLNYVNKLLRLYEFTQLYFCFPENKRDYERVKDELIDFVFVNNYRLSNKLVISLFPIVSKRKWENGCDLREVMSCIIDFFKKIEPLNHKIYFCGIYHFVDVFYFFRNIECSIQIAKNIKEVLNADENEEIVALQTVTPSNDFVNYFISVEQYEILRDRIRIFSISNSKYMCMIA